MTIGVGRRPRPVLSRRDRYPVAQMADAHINPAMLRWAMRRVGASTQDIAAMFTKTDETVDSWVAGNAAPTFNQARRLAKRLRIPFGYLFLTDAPSDELPLPDFRRVHGQTERSTSVDLPRRDRRRTAKAGLVPGLPDRRGRGTAGIRRLVQSRRSRDTGCERYQRVPRLRGRGSTQGSG